MTLSIYQALHQFLTLLHVLILILLPNLTFFFNQIAIGFHRTFATDGMPTEKLTPPDTWSCPTLGLANVLMLRPISPELVFVLGLLSFDHPSVLLFCFIHCTRNWLFCEVGSRYFSEIKFKIRHEFVHSVSNQIAEPRDVRNLKSGNTTCSGENDLDMITNAGSGGGRVVKLLACGARGPGFDSPPRHLNFRDWLSPASKSRYG